MKDLQTNRLTTRTIILSGFILAKFLLQYFLYNPDYDLQRDEFLHLDQANHPAWGYLSIPPVTSWISYLIGLAGNSVFWIRFFPALFGALTILIVWKTIEELKGNMYALILGSTCVLLSFLLRLNFLFQPNSLDVLCWTAFYFSLIKYFNNKAQKWLFIAALVFALGFLNKYNVVFMLLGLLPALLITDQRSIFRERNLYVSALLAILLISPNLYWQYSHGFPVFHHLRELTSTQLVNVNRWGFLKEQLFFFMGALPVTIASLCALLLYAPFKKYRFFFWTLVFTLAVFVYFRAKGYYAIGIYPIYIALGAVFLGNILQSGWKKRLLLGIMALPVILYLMLFNVVYSIERPQQIVKKRDLYQKLGLLHWEDGKDHALPQDFADMLGWKELAAKVDSAYHKLPKGTHTLILCDNYGQAGAINYYTKNKDIRAVSFSADYINWFDLGNKIDNLIRVKDEIGIDNELGETGPLFDRGFISGSITNSLAREYKATIFVFTGAKTDVNQRLKDEIRQEQAHE